MPAPKARARKKNRSGSEKRQRGVINKFRSTVAERAEMKANACAAGFTFGSFMRSIGCANPTTRAVRDLAPAVAALHSYKGQLGHVAGNLAQFLKLANTQASRGETVRLDDLAPALQETRALMALLSAALDGKL